jgi:hypothetical protein
MVGISYRRDALHFGRKLLYNPTPTQSQRRKTIKAENTAEMTVSEPGDILTVPTYHEDGKVCRKQYTKQEDYFKLLMNDYFIMVKWDARDAYGHTIELARRVL